MSLLNMFILQSEPEKVEPLQTASEFAVSLQPCLVKEGEKAELMCQVTGEPAPQLTWMLNGEPLTIEGRYSVVERDGLKVLQVDNVVPSDIGEYTVTATNSLGEASCSADMTVEGKLELR